MGNVVSLRRHATALDDAVIVRRGSLTIVRGGDKPEGIAESLPFSEISQEGQPRLTAALDAWNEITDGRGVFDFAELPGELIMENPRIFTERTSVLVVSGEHPLDFIFLWYPRTLDIYGNEDFILRPVRDSARDNILVAAADAMQEVLDRREPVLHKLQGICDGMMLVYHRLLLPCVDSSGEVVRIVAISEDVMREKWR